MQLPDTLLAAKLPAAAKTVLTALWRSAEGEPAWTAPRVVDVAAAVGMDVRYVRRLLVLLTARGALRREARSVGARRLLGFGLCRSVSPLQPARARRPLATGQNGRNDVAKRDRAHKLTERDDMMTIAKHARRGDSEKRIVESLLRADAPCSTDRWYSVKVHRRIAVMREEIGGCSPGTRAGDVVARWKMLAEAEGKRRSSAREAMVPDARIDFGAREDD